MYQLMFDNNGASAPIVTKPKLNEADALWWADRLRELQSKFSVNIVHTAEDWLTDGLPQTTGPRTERPGAEYGIGVEG